MEHDSFPVSVLVHVGDHQVPATAHGRRAGPHGDQTLVCIDGHYVWVCSTRVIPVAAAGPATSMSGDVAVGR